MVVYKGTQRLFDKIFEEPSTSTGTVRTLAITGVTAYSKFKWSNIRYFILRNRRSKCNS